MASPPARRPTSAGPRTSTSSLLKIVAPSRRRDSTCSRKQGPWIPMNTMLLGTMASSSEMRRAFVPLLYFP